MSDSITPESAEPAELCASDRAILDLEESWQAGSLGVDKETAIRDSLGLSSPRYHLRLNELIDDEKAAQYAPSLVGRFSGFATSNAAPVAHNCSDDTYGVDNDATRREAHYETPDRNGSDVLLGLLRCDPRHPRKRG